MPCPPNANRTYSKRRPRAKLAKASRSATGQARHDGQRSPEYGSDHGVQGQGPTNGDGDIPGASVRAPEVIPISSAPTKPAPSRNTSIPTLRAIIEALQRRTVRDTLRGLLSQYQLVRRNATRMRQDEFLGSPCHLGLHDGWPRASLGLQPAAENRAALSLFSRVPLRSWRSCRPRAAAREGASGMTSTLCTSSHSHDGLQRLP